MKIISFLRIMSFVFILIKTQRFYADAKSLKKIISWYSQIYSKKNPPQIFVQDEEEEEESTTTESKFANSSDDIKDYKNENLEKLKKIFVDANRKFNIKDTEENIHIKGEEGINCNSSVKNYTNEYTDKNMISKPRFSKSRSIIRNSEENQYEKFNFYNDEGNEETFQGNNSNGIHLLLNHHKPHFEVNIPANVSINYKTDDSKDSRPIEVAFRRSQKKNKNLVIYDPYKNWIEKILPFLISKLTNFKNILTDDSALRRFKRTDLNLENENLKELVQNILSNIKNQSQPPHTEDHNKYSIFNGSNVPEKKLLENLTNKLTNLLNLCYSIKVPATGTAANVMINDDSEVNFITMAMDTSPLVSNQESASTCNEGDCKEMCTMFAKDIYGKKGSSNTATSYYNDELSRKILQNGHNNKLYSHYKEIDLPHSQRSYETKSEYRSTKSVYDKIYAKNKINRKNILRKATNFMFTKQLGNNIATGTDLSNSKQKLKRASSSVLNKVKQRNNLQQLLSSLVLTQPKLQNDNQIEKVKGRNKLLHKILIDKEIIQNHGKPVKTKEVLICTRQSLLKHNTSKFRQYVNNSLNTKENFVSIKTRVPLNQMEINLANTLLESDLLKEGYKNQNNGMSKKENQQIEIFTELLNSALLKILRRKTNVPDLRKTKNLVEFINIIKNSLNVEQYDHIISKEAKKSLQNSLNITTNETNNGANLLQLHTPSLYNKQNSYNKIKLIEKNLNACKPSTDISPSNTIGITRIKIFGFIYEADNSCTKFSPKSYCHHSISNSVNVSKEFNCPNTRTPGSPNSIDHGTRGAGNNSTIYSPSSNFDHSNPNSTPFTKKPGSHKDTCADTDIASFPPILMAESLTPSQNVNITLEPLITVQTLSTPESAPFIYSPPPQQPQSQKSMTSPVAGAEATNLCKCLENSTSGPNISSTMSITLESRVHQYYMDNVTYSYEYTIGMPNQCQERVITEAAKTLDITLLKKLVAILQSNNNYNKHNFKNKKNNKMYLNQ